MQGAGSWQFASLRMGSSGVVGPVGRRSGTGVLKGGVRAAAGDGWDGRLVEGSSQGHIGAAELGSFVPHHWPGRGESRSGAEPVTASVKVESRCLRQKLRVNEFREFHRVMAQPGEVVQVRLVFGRGGQGGPVLVCAQDGGVLEGGRRSAQGRLDAARHLAFGFRLSSERAMHRVTVRAFSGEVMVLDFWAGDPLPRRPDQGGLVR